MAHYFSVYQSGVYSLKFNFFWLYFKLKDR